MPGLQDVGSRSGGTPSRGSCQAREHWHSRGESARTDASTLPDRVLAGVRAASLTGCPRGDRDAGLAADDRGCAVCWSTRPGPGPTTPATRCGSRASYDVSSPTPRRPPRPPRRRSCARKAVAKFGDAAHQMFFTPDALEQSTRAASPTTGPPGWRPRSPAAASSTSAAASAATSSPSPGPACRGRHRPGPGARGDGARPTSPPSGLAGAVLVGRRHHHRPERLRRRLRRPGPPRRPGPGLRRRGMDPAVAVGAGPADPALAGQGRAGHRPRPGPCRRRGGVGQRRR